MLAILLRYLRLRTLRRSIEDKKRFADVQPDLGKYTFNLRIPQKEEHLALIKTYMIGWMNARKKTTISSREFKQINFVSRLSRLEQVKEAKKILWELGGDDESRTLPLHGFLNYIKNVPRFEEHFIANDHVNPDINPSHRNRALVKMRKIHKKHFTYVRLYANMHESWFRQLKPVMSFEIDHFEALRVENGLSINYESMKRFNKHKEWPTTSDMKGRFKLGWITFEVKMNGTVHVTEIQSPAEQHFVNKETGTIHYFMEQPNWSSFMLEQFLQYFVLRGFTRFTVATVSRKKIEMGQNVKVVEFNYRHLPRAFGFERINDLWVLDLGQ